MISKSMLYFKQPHREKTAMPILIDLVKIITIQIRVFNIVFVVKVLYFIQGILKGKVSL